MMRERPDISPRAALANNRWFAALSAPLQTALIDAAVIRAVPTGRWIYGSGDAPRGLYAVLEGTALVYVTLPHVEDVLVHATGPGEIFGHAAQVARGPRLATVLAARPSTFLFLSERALAGIASRHPEVWQHLTRLLYEQLGEALTLLAQTLSQSIGSRLANRLLQLSRSGPNHDAPICLSQSQVAELLGVARKTVNHLLQDLAHQGAIELRYRQIAVRDAKALMALARKAQE